MDFQASILSWKTNNNNNNSFKVFFNIFFMLFYVNFREDLRIRTFFALIWFSNYIEYIFYIFLYYYED